jgi:hypothetical protein
MVIAHAWVPRSMAKRVAALALHAAKKIHTGVIS